MLVHWCLGNHKGCLWDAGKKEDASSKAPLRAQRCFIGFGGALGGKPPNRKHPGANIHRQNECKQSVHGSAAWGKTLPRDRGMKLLLFHASAQLSKALVFFVAASFSDPRTSRKAIRGLGYKVLINQGPN